jgi:hypothetical protein
MKGTGNMSKNSMFTDLDFSNRYCINDKFSATIFENWGFIIKDGSAEEIIIEPPTTETYIAKFLKPYDQKHY